MILDSSHIFLSFFLSTKLFTFFLFFLFDFISSTNCHRFPIYHHKYPLIPAVTAAASTLLLMVLFDFIVATKWFALFCNIKKQKHWNPYMLLWSFYYVLSVDGKIQWSTSWLWAICCQQYQLHFNTLLKFCRD